MPSAFMRRQHSCWVVILSLAICLSTVSASLPHSSNFLHLVNRHRELAGNNAPAPKSKCSGKKPGDPIEGQYMVVFDNEKVSSVSEGLSEVRKHLQQATAQSSAAFPEAPTQPTTPADPFAVLRPLTSVPEPSSSAAVGRRLHGSRRHRLSPYLGAVVRVPPEAQGAALVQQISQASVVKAVVQDVCVKALDSQERFSCLPATMLSSTIQQPVASATWDGCVTPNTYLAWWGERCGSSFNEVQWVGVYAFDKTTGARLASCVKQRPSGGGSIGSDLTFWLGGCGLAPAAVPTLPVRVCRDPYVDETVLPADDQGCMVYNFTEATQTLQVMHPTPACGASQPVNMTYRGQRCTGNSGNAATSSSTAGVLWQSAEPAAGSGLDAAACSLQRRTGTTTEDLIFNMDWFGSCGVPPARVQYIPRSECPAPPPPPPPSPSPRPEDQKALDRTPVLAGETAPAGLRRILAVTPSTNGSGLDTVKIMRSFTVAVMDSGVDCNHRDLNVVFNISFTPPVTPDDQMRDTKGCWDMYDHGTNVAGIIGARNNGWGVVGILPDIPIASLKMLDSEGYGDASNIIAACLWLLADSLDGVNPNPDNSSNAEVLGIEAINMSFGFNNNPTSGSGLQVCNMMARLHEAGILIAAAAGNENEPINQMIPAACEGVLAVTAIEQGNGTIDVTQDAATEFTNFLDLNPSSPYPLTAFKTNLTVAAPGRDIYSTCFQYYNTYCERTGTSQATPHVTGMLARCISGGRCTHGANGTASSLYAARKWAQYNLDNSEYGYAKDPIRFSKSVFYYGYLTCADVW